MIPTTVTSVVITDLRGQARVKYYLETAFASVAVVQYLRKTDLSRYEIPLSRRSSTLVMFNAAAVCRSIIRVDVLFFYRVDYTRSHAPSTFHLLNIEVPKIRSSPSFSFLFFKVFSLHFTSLSLSSSSNRYFFSLIFTLPQWRSTMSVRQWLVSIQFTLADSFTESLRSVEKSLKPDDLFDPSDRRSRLPQRQWSNAETSSTIIRLFFLFLVPFSIPLS